MNIFVMHTLLFTLKEKIDCIYASEKERKKKNRSGNYVWLSFDLLLSYYYIKTKKTKIKKKLLWKEKKIFPSLGLSVMVFYMHELNYCI